MLDDQAVLSYRLRFIAKFLRDEVKSLLIEHKKDKKTKKTKATWKIAIKKGYKDNPDTKEQISITKQLIQKSGISRFHYDGKNLEISLKDGIEISFSKKEVIKLANGNRKIVMEKINEYKKKKEIEEKDKKNLNIAIVGIITLAIFLTAILCFKEEITRWTGINFID